MKLFYFSFLFLIFINNLSFGSPVKTTTDEVDTTTKNLDKRYDVATYIASMAHHFLSDNIKHAKYGKNNNDLDIYYDDSNTGAKNPVVIYIFGGSWYLGEKSMYSRLGDNLRNFGFVSVIPNYVQFPFGTLDAMTHDISEIIKWVYHHIEQYGGDPNQIIVLGHSSGAHLIALTLLKNTLALESKTGSDYFISDLPPLKRVVLLNGPYDFDLLSDEARKTGIKIENSNTRKLLETALCSKDASPTEILKKYGDHSIRNFGVDLIVLMHAEEDATVPVVSSYDLLNEIRRTSSNPATVYLTHGYYHCGITEGVMNGDRVAMEYLVRGLIADNFDVPCFNVDSPNVVETKKSDDQARKQAEEWQRKQAEEQKRKQEEEWKRKQEEEWKRKQEEEEWKRKQEEEWKRKQEEEWKRKQAEEEWKRKQEEEEWKRKQEEEQARKQAEEQAQPRFEDMYEWNGEMWVMKDKKTNDYWNTSTDNSNNYNDDYQYNNQGNNDHWNNDRWNNNNGNYDSWNTPDNNNIYDNVDYQNNQNSYNGNNDEWSWNNPDNNNSYNDNYQYNQGNNDNWNDNSWSNNNWDNNNGNNDSWKTQDNDNWNNNNWDNNNGNNNSYNDNYQYDQGNNDNWNDNNWSNNNYDYNNNGNTDSWNNNNWDNNNGNTDSWNNNNWDNNNGNNDSWKTQDNGIWNNNNGNNDNWNDNNWNNNNWDNNNGNNDSWKPQDNYNYNNDDYQNPYNENNNNWSWNSNNSKYSSETIPYNGSNDYWFEDEANKPNNDFPFMNGNQDEKPWW